jgi:hypothetical protein
VRETEKRREEAGYDGNCWEKEEKHNERNAIP